MTRVSSLSRTQELRLASQDNGHEAPRGDSLKGLAAERDRLQRQVTDMRTDVSAARQDLTAQHEKQKVQTDELRSTLHDLQADAERLQIEQRKQAAALKSTLAKNQVAEVSTRLEKQVEGVASIVASQDQRFDRLEHELTTAYETQRTALQQALSENRNLAKGLEDDGKRRAKAMMDLVEKVSKKDYGVGQLSNELQQATHAIQGQSADWTDLSRKIGGEVHNLAAQLKADRDSRALEQASQRTEIVKMVEDARRQGAMDALSASQNRGIPDSVISGLGHDMLSRPGVSAVRQMVDMTGKIMYDMESQLIIRASFIAGVFHTWRCEATLWKVGRRYQEEFSKNQDEWEAHLQHHRQSFEEDMILAAEQAHAHKEHVRQQKELLCRKMLLGEEKALFNSTFFAWRDYIKTLKTEKSTAAAIQKACYQWIEGNAKGLKRSVVASWHHRAKEDVVERKRNSELDAHRLAMEGTMNQALSDAERKLAEGMEQLEKLKDGKKKDLEVVLAKWARGDAKGVMTTCFQALGKWMIDIKKKKVRSASTTSVVNGWLEGKAKAAKQMCWMMWKKEALDSHKFNAEKKQLTDLLDNERAKLQREWKELHNEQKNRVERAHNAVYLMLQKWARGETEGLKVHCFQVWSRHSSRVAAENRRLNSVHMSIGKWVRGEAKGALQIVFINWKNDAHQGALERKHKDNELHEQERLQGFLADEKLRHENELESLKSKAQRAMDKAHAAIMESVQKWAMGNDKGLMKSVVQAWKDFTMATKKAARNRQGVHEALLKQFAGEDKALKMMIVKNWASLAKGESVERKQEDLIAKEKAHWEDSIAQMQKLHEQELRGHLDEAAQRKLQAREQTEMMVRRWAGKENDVSEFFALWRRVIASRRSSRKSKTAVKDTVKRFIEGESRGIRHSTFLEWREYVGHHKHAVAVDRLEKTIEKMIGKHAMHLQKYATFISAKSGPALKGLVFNTWKELSQGEKYLLEERKREVQIEEMERKAEMERTRKKEARVKALANLGMKDSKIILMEIFLAWSYLYQQWRQERIHKINANKALSKYADVMLLKQMTKDATAMLTSSFAEWHREAKHNRHQEVLQHLEESQVYISQLKAGFEEQLAMAYQQIDHITETLHKELQTKEEMAQELREAYEKQRRSFGIMMTDQTPPGGGSVKSRPGSAGSRSLSLGGGRPARPSGPPQAPTSCGSCGNIYATEPTIISPSAASAPGSRAGRLSGGPLHTAPSVPNGGSLELPRSRVSSPGRDNWDYVVDRLEDKGMLHDRGLRF